MGELPRAALGNIAVVLVLGIDAAWTEHGSSALALLRVGDASMKSRSTSKSAKSNNVLAAFVPSVKRLRHPGGSKTLTGL
jgi:hypothetical protein